MTKFLEVGDVIHIQKGMTIYARIPEKFRFSNRSLSNEPTTGEVCVGEIRKNNISDWDKRKANLLNDIKGDFNSEFGFVPTEAIEAFVTAHIPSPIQETLDTICFAGEYVVVETSLSGGSVDSYHANNSYPDGHHVICKKLIDGAFDPNGEKISFYQSGSFTAMIKTIEPVRKMNRTFVG